MAELPHQTWSAFRHFRKMRLPVLVLAAFLACASVPASQAQSAQPAPPSLSDLRPTLIVGFVGGFVSRHARAHGEVQFAEHLRQIYPSNVQVKVFENRRLSQAREEVLGFVRDARKQMPSPRDDASESGSRAPNLILYGHSWGAARSEEHT